MIRAALERTRLPSESSRLDRRACEAALAAIAQGCEAELKRHIPSAARADANSLHKVRTALTRLRTAIRFFRPAIDHCAWKKLQHEARWLSRHAGKARDLDAALAHHKGATHRSVKDWRRQRERRYKGLRAALHLPRYRKFVEDLTRRGGRHPSAPRSRDATRQLEDFSISRLERWRQKLVSDTARLKEMGTHRRHRLRMRAKRLKYALEWSEALLEAERPMLRKQIEQAKIIQNALGKLNDGAIHRIQARKLKLAQLPRMAQLDRPKSRRKLLKDAEGALEKLARMKLTRTS